MQQDTELQIDIDFGDFQERVSCQRTQGDCQECGAKAVQVHTFTHPAVEPETGPLVLCEACIAKDAELTLVAGAPAPGPHAEAVDKLRRAIERDGRAYAYITWTGPEHLGGYDNEPGDYTGNYKVFGVEEYEGELWLECKELSGIECDIRVAEATAIVVD